ncbi:MAG: Hsp20/alpha crystallin family protein [Acidobacteriota bacterium]
MYQERTDVLPAFRDLQETVNRMFDETFRGFLGGGTPTRTVVAPIADIYETADQLVFEFEIPGVDKDSINISFDNGLLTISGERKAPADDKRTYHRSERWYGRFERSFRMPTSIDPEKIEARLENGVLRVVVPKREEAKTRQIPVTVG